MRMLNATQLAYPSSLPIPLQRGYGVALNNDTIETPMESGWTRSRRVSPYTMRTGKLSFSCNTYEFMQLTAFIKSASRAWVDMPLQSDKTLGLVQNETVRFMSNIQFEYVDWDSVQVNVDVEFYIDQGAP